MRDYPNIEKSGFRRGEYIGYADGVWRIFRWGTGWRAFCRLHADHINLYADTLRDMSALLEEEATKKHATYEGMAEGRV